MMAITIWQPWATLIAIGAKPYEFRSWPAPARLHGQRIAIHAGARLLKKHEIADLIMRLRGDKAWATALKPDLALPLLERVHTSPDVLPRSCVVATVVLGAPRQAYEIAPEFGGTVNDSDRDDHATWAWPMGGVEQLLPPREAKGAQGFWHWGGE